MDEFGSFLALLQLSQAEFRCLPLEKRLLIAQSYHRPNRLPNDASLNRANNDASLYCANNYDSTTAQSYRPNTLPNDASLNDTELSSVHSNDENTLPSTLPNNDNMSTDAAYTSYAFQADSDSDDDCGYTATSPSNLMSSNNTDENDVSTSKTGENEADGSPTFAAFSTQDMFQSFSHQHALSTGCETDEELQANEEHEENEDWAYCTPHRRHVSSNSPRQGEDIKQRPSIGTSDSLTAYHRLQASSNSSRQEEDIKQRPSVGTSSDSLAIYHRLHTSPGFRGALDQVRGIRYERKRFTFPTPRVILQADFFGSLHPESVLWVRRLAAVIGFPSTQNLSEDDDDKSEGISTDRTYTLTQVELFKDLVTPVNLLRFREYLKESACTFNPSTIRKGLFQIQFAIQALAGKRFSKVGNDEKQACEASLACLQDLCFEYNKSVSLANNHAEEQRIHHRLQNVDASTMLRKLYFVFLTCSFKAKVLFEQSERSTKELDFLVGYVVFAVMMARPTSRAQMITQLNTAQFEDKKARNSAGGDLVLTFTSHKTMTSYGTLVAVLPPWCTEVIDMYRLKLRPISGAVKSSLFPCNWQRFLDKFLVESGFPPASLNVSSIRKICCDAIGEIRAGEPYYEHTSSLQATAGHALQKTAVVEKFYEISAKISREHTLQEWLSVRFMQPCVQEIGNVEFPSTLTVNMVVPTAKQKKRKHQALARRCRNSKMGKKCFSTNLDFIEFATPTSQNCVQCQERYGTNGNFTPARAKRIKASENPSV